MSPWCERTIGEGCGDLWTGSSWEMSLFDTCGSCYCADLYEISGVYHLSYELMDLTDEQKRLIVQEVLNGEEMVLTSEVITFGESILTGWERIVQSVLAQHSDKFLNQPMVHSMADFPQMQTVRVRLSLRVDGMQDMLASPRPSELACPLRVLAAMTS